jgi:hypothetical protein
MRIGVLVIGSLLWDESKIRRDWRNNNLDLNTKIKVKIPIRYGRSSSSRNNNYSMIFSSYLSYNNLGIGYVIPLKVDITDENSFSNQLQKLAIAEGIIDECKKSKKSIVTDWGSVCLLLNNKSENSDTIFNWWGNIYSQHKILFSTLNPRKNLDFVNGYNTLNEIPIISENGIFAVNIFNQKELEKFDIIIATANKIMLINKSIKYPNANEIAKTMIDSADFSYFVNNLKHGITTFEDKLILKIFRKKYGINLRKKFKIK